MTPRKTGDQRQFVFNKHFSGNPNFVIFLHFAVISWLFSVICWSFTVILWEKVEISSHFPPFLKLPYLRAFHHSIHYFHPFLMETPPSPCTVFVTVLGFSVTVSGFVVTDSVKFHDEKSYFPTSFHFRIFAKCQSSCI